jgi:hypothetical protein
MSSNALRKSYKMNFLIRYLIFPEMVFFLLMVAVSENH